MTLEERVHREVVSFHRFFQDWLTGKLPNNDEAYARLGASLEEGFLLVTPNANEATKPDILGFIRSEHGSRPGLEMSIHGFRLVHQIGSVVIVRYEEHEAGEGKDTKRVCTAALRETDAAPTGFRWLSTQETWIS